MQGFERMLYYEQYPEEKSRLWLSSFKKNWSTFTSNRVHIIQIPSAAPFFMGIHLNLHLKSCAYHPDSECCTFFHGNLSDPKSSEDTLIYFYVIWNMLKFADIHEKKKEE